MGIPAAGQHSDGLAGPGEVLQALSEEDLAVGEIVVVHGEQAETVLGRVLSRQCPRPRRRDLEPSAPPARRAPMAAKGGLQGAGAGRRDGRGWGAPPASRGARPVMGHPGLGSAAVGGEVRGEREHPAPKVGRSNVEGERHRWGMGGADGRRGGVLQEGEALVGGGPLGSTPGERKSWQVGGAS